MRTITFVLTATALAPAVRAAPAPLPRPCTNKAELRKLRGEWVRVHYRSDGRTYPTPITAVIRGHRMRYGATPGTDEWLITLDATKKPKVFDVTGHGSTRGVVFRGVYRLEGDTLTICSVRAAGEADRPKDLTGRRAGQFVEVFKRRKH
jgi:uncharacterized protein (TIGR03067 family)